MPYRSILSGAVVATEHNFFYACRWVVIIRSLQLADRGSVVSSKDCSVILVEFVIFTEKNTVFMLSIS